MKAVLSDAQRACRASRTAGGLGTIGLVIQAFLATPGGPSNAQLVAIVACALLWLWTLVTRRPASVWFGSALFLAINAAIMVGLWAGTQQIAASGIHWVPFRAHHLGVLAIAMLAPPVVWVGVIAIIAMTGAALLQFALFAPEIRDHLPYGDPWSTLFFGGFALVLLIYRINADRNEREIAHAQAKAESYQRYARAMLAIRDLSNTPLQTLTNIIAILREGGKHLDDTLPRLERTVARMTELEQLTRPFEDHLEWVPGDEGWDPRTILRHSAERP